MKRKILVTGATGLTGSKTTELLLKQGFEVRAFVHKIDHRSDKLEVLGAEVVSGDMLDHEWVRVACEGINAAYFIYPIAHGLINATAYFAQAAREAGFDLIVNMSQKSARENSRSHAARDHWIAERVFDWSGVPTTHIRPTFFAEWLTYPHHLKQIVENGAIVQALGSGRHAPIASFDQARFIAAVLADPASHRGKTYPLCGPVEMDQYTLAEKVGKVIGKHVEYKPISIEALGHKLEAAGLSPFRIQHLCAVAQDYQDGIFEGTDEIIGRVTGTPPMTVEEFVTSNIALFRQQR
ncbi:NmrA family NAD(P)-binding protein [Silvibacterium acidisoli]|uniref:NmrA family NAD(P)-binding protein n=1 Tax=Acidobacteriaceae bacterium ZG23-2 TaxID=2883246 RepID=UPI00406CC542